MKNLKTTLFEETFYHRKRYCALKRELGMYAELKASDGRPSELQKHNVAQINKSGSIAMVLYPEGFEQFKLIVKGVKECNGHIAELNVLKNAHSSSKCNILTV